MKDDPKPDLNESPESKDSDSEELLEDKTSPGSDDLKNLFKDDDGQDSDDGSKDEASEEPPENNRRVAKTLLETEIPNFDDSADKKTERPVAKTLLETELPDLEKLSQASLEEKGDFEEDDLAALDEIKGEIEKIANSGEHEKTKAIAKTLMESDLPSLDRIREEIEKQTSEKNDENQESTVAKTMLESDFPDLLRIHSLIAKKESQLELKKQSQLDLDKTEIEAEAEESIEISEKEEKEAFELSPGVDAGKESRLHQAISQSVTPKIRHTKIILNRPISRSFSMISFDSTKKEVLSEPQVDQFEEPLVPLNETDALDELDLEVESRVDSEVQEEESKPFPAETAPAPQAKPQRRREEYVAKTMLDHELILDSLSESIMRIEQKEKEDMEAKIASQPPKEEITKFKNAKACPWTWEDTGTDDKFRYCGQCENLVYNFDDCSMPEAEALVYQRENREKFQLFKREDGKFMTKDCPEAEKKATRTVLMVVAGVTVLFLMVAAIALMPKSSPPASTESATQTEVAPAPAPGGNQTRTFVNGKEVTTGSGDSQTNPSATVNPVQPDGTFIYNADDPRHNAPPPAILQERTEGKDYSNVPEADPSGKQWEF